jgi:hypothetical protein
MPKSRVLRVALGLAPLAAALLWASVSSGSVLAASSEQVVFSKTGGFGTFNSTPTPFGFWIWCEADSANPYQSVCNGSMYFYALGVPEGVTGHISELAEGKYQMTVNSADNTIACTLINELPVRSGANNTIDVACTSPSGSGTAGGAVVQVTGP